MSWITIIRTSDMDLLIGGIFEMAANLTNLTREVEESRTVMESASALIMNLADEIRANMADQGALEALATSLDEKANQLAEAVAANTVAEDEEPTPEPEPEPTE